MVAFTLHVCLDLVAWPLKIRSRAPRYSWGAGCRVPSSEPCQRFFFVQMHPTGRGGLELGRESGSSFFLSRRFFEPPTSQPPGGLVPQKSQLEKERQQPYAGSACLMSPLFSVSPLLCALPFVELPQLERQTYLRRPLVHHGGTLEGTYLTSLPRVNESPHRARILQLLSAASAFNCVSVSEVLWSTVCLFFPLCPHNP